MRFGPGRMNGVMAEDERAGNVIADVFLKFVIKAELKSLWFTFL